MNLNESYVQDVMQVCGNGHVITDLLNALPERALGHCDRCGAVTYDRCLTCGHPIPGGCYVPGAMPIGEPTPPKFCASCGAAYPWTRRPPGAPGPGPLSALESLLRKLPAVARQLRDRQGERPPFRVDDERDLEDLVRALLPLRFDDVRLESRTPGYAKGTRTDFLLGLSGIALTCKKATSAQGERQLGEQLQEDVAYYRKQPACRTLVCLVYDPEAVLFNPRQIETVWASCAEEMSVRPVIAS
jgi:hypothetical protein